MRTAGAKALVCNTKALRRTAHVRVEYHTLRHGSVPGRVGSTGDTKARLWIQRAGRMMMAGAAGSVR